MTTWFHIEPLLAVILWGGVYPGAKLGLHEIPVLRFTALRILVAMVLLFIVPGRVQTVPLSRSLWPLVLRAGLAQTVFQLLLIGGLRWTTASKSAILLATTPLLTAGWLAVTGRVSLRNGQWAGLGVGFVGVWLVIQGHHMSATWSHWGGDVLAFGAAGAWVWYGIVIGPLVGRLGAARATGWTMVVAACGFTPLALIEMQAYAWRSVSWAAWAGLLYGATVGMVLAMALWGRAIQRLGPQQTMVYVYLAPLSAVVIAAATLGEALSPIQAVGALLTFIGVGLASSQE
jgi:drug/metabolite transporter (DMT)-like permease